MSEQERAFGLQAGVVLVDHVVSAESVADDVPSVLGQPARSFEQLAADYAAVFSRRPGSRHGRGPGSSGSTGRNLTDPVDAISHWCLARPPDFVDAARPNYPPGAGSG